MDHISAPVDSRAGRRRRRLILGAIAGVLIAGALVAVGTMRTSNTGTSGAATRCPTIDSVTHIPAPAPSTEVDWNHCDLSNAILTDAHLEGVDLKSATLTDAILTGAHLNGAFMNGATLTRATLTSADLTGAHLAFATMNDAIYSSTICPNTTNSAAQTPESCAGQGGGL